MAKIISTIALVIMLVLFPPAALVTISQNAVPGDLTYPVKRKLEDAILFIASFNPTSRAYFAIAQTQRRYREATALLNKGEDAQESLHELVAQTSIATKEVETLTSASQKEQFIDDLTVQIDKYDQGLDEAQQKISQEIQIEVTRTPEPTVKPTPTPTQTQAPGRQTPKFTQTPTQAPTTPPPPQTQTFSPNQQQLLDQQKAIEEARRQLEELKRKLEEERRRVNLESTKTPIKTPSPTPKPTNTPTPKPTPTPTPHKESKTPSPSSNYDSTNRDDD